MPPTGIEIGILFLSYVIGCLVLGYYLTRWLTGVDLRATGSGNVGARNASRVLGTTGLVTTVMWDVGKGSAVGTIAYMMGVDGWTFWLTGLAVSAGHIWPAQLGFRGGKGVATAGGFLLVFDHLLIVAFIVIVLLNFVFLRKLTPSGLIAIALLPVSAATMGYRFVDILGIIALVIIVLGAHWHDLKVIMSGIRASHQEK